MEKRWMGKCMEFDIKDCLIELNKKIVSIDEDEIQKIEEEIEPEVELSRKIMKELIY
jgi:hypothetical protein